MPKMKKSMLIAVYDQRLFLFKLNLLDIEKLLIFLKNVDFVLKDSQPTIIIWLI